jgi:hypothetical protein
MSMLNFLAKLLGYKNIGGEGTGSGYILKFEYSKKK